jgi:NADH-quinone oxidoreductase subunit L
VIGALTAVFAATIGLKQWDIKKVLAYSTVSQLGYMFVGVGVGAYTAGVFHLMTHAFFKALLFLGSGSVIYAMHQAYHATHNHEDAQDMRNMGGLKEVHAHHVHADVDRDARDRRHPAVLGLLLQGRDPRVGLRADARLDAGRGEPAWRPGSAVLMIVYVLGLAAALMTAVYMTRMMLYTFHGPNRTGEKEQPHLKEAPWVMTGPLVVLGVLSRSAGSSTSRRSSRRRVGGDPAPLAGAGGGRRDEAGAAR